MPRRTLKYDTVVAFLVEKGARAGTGAPRPRSACERIRADLAEPPGLGWSGLEEETARAHNIDVVAVGVGLR